MTFHCILLLLQLCCMYFCVSGSSRAYAESPIMFSPDGRILQLDAANAAVEKGSLILVVTTKGCRDVLLFFVKKRDTVSKLQISSRDQLYRIDESRKNLELLLCATGWVSDAGVYSKIFAYFLLALFFLIFYTLYEGPVQRLADRVCLDYLEKFGIAIPSKILASSMGISIHDA